MKNPKITIITPSYNQGQFIEQTILSVLAQSYKNIQYIIIDGGSTDNSMDIINKYRNQLDIVLHEKDKGQADAINKGFRLATGQLVGWINSDDILYPTAAESAAAFYTNTPKAVIMPTSIDWMDNKGTFIKKVAIQAQSVDDLLNHNYNIIQPGSFYDYTALKKVAFCNGNLHYCMDLDLVLRLAKIGGIGFIDKSLAGFRIWNDSKTTTGGVKFIQEIQATITHYGAKKYARTRLKLRYYLLKELLKKYADQIY